MTAETYAVFRGLREKRLVGPVWPSPGGYMVGVAPMFNLASAEFESTSFFISRVWQLAGQELPAVERERIHRAERSESESAYLPSSLRYRRAA